MKKEATDSDSKMWTLGKYKGGNDLNIVFKDCDGLVLIHLAITSHSMGKIAGI